jgi:hypothetical protein
VIDSGKMDFYERKRDYLDHNDPIDIHPFILRQFTLTLDVGYVAAKPAQVARKSVYDKLSRCVRCRTGHTTAEDSLSPDSLGHEKS